MKQRIATLFILPLFTILFFGYFGGRSHALSGTDFKPGRIIDDSVFTNANSMDVAHIQQFLVSKVSGGSCDSDGSRPSTRYNSTANRYYTHAEWGTLNSNPAPFVCLTTYRENSATKQTNLGNPGALHPGDGSQSAAEIIFSAGQQYNINPQALIILLQKEQSLITDDWPWASQYASATGAYCPDTAGCDATKAGFGTQVREAARLFRSYMDSPFLYFIGNNTILYNPNRSCSSSTVYIENLATVALYHYTPYQPDATALNNLYGIGDSCSAYGNRNFWRLFNDWFGNTLGNKPTTSLRWGFENLDGGVAGLKPRNDTVGINPASIQYGDNLYIFYQNSTKHTLELATASSTGWAYQTLDGDTTQGGRLLADVGRSAMPVIYNNELHVFYYDATNGNLRHAWFTTATGWSYETLDGDTTTPGGYNAKLGMSNFAIVYNNELHVFYYDATNGNLRHATKSGNVGWKFENLDGDLGSIGGLNSDIGQNPTATVYGTSLQLFYYDVNNGNLRHAWKTLTNVWKFENLDGDIGSIARNTGNVGQDPTVTVYGTSLQLFYYDVNNGNLRHAWVTDTQSWKFENLEGDQSSVSHYNTDVGSGAKALVFKDSLYIFYRENSAGLMRHAWADGGGWHFANLEGTAYSVTGLISNTGFWPSPAIYGDSLQLYYFDNDQRSLRHAWGIAYW
jgi:hypothetical protein